MLYYVVSVSFSLWTVPIIIIIIIIIIIVVVVVIAVVVVDVAVVYRPLISSGPPIISVNLVVCLFYFLTNYVRRK